MGSEIHQLLSSGSATLPRIEVYRGRTDESVMSLQLPTDTVDEVVKHASGYAATRRILELSDGTGYEVAGHPDPAVIYVTTGFANLLDNLGDMALYDLVAQRITGGRGVLFVSPPGKPPTSPLGLYQEYEYVRSKSLVEPAEGSKPGAHSILGLRPVDGIRYLADAIIGDCHMEPGSQGVQIVAKDTGGIFASSLALALDPERVKVGGLTQINRPGFAGGRLPMRLVRQLVDESRHTPGVGYDDALDPLGILKTKDGLYGVGVPSLDVRGGAIESGLLSLGTVVSHYLAQGQNSELLAWEHTAIAERHPDAQLNFAWSDRDPLAPIGKDRKLTDRTIHVSRLFLGAKPDSHVDHTLIPGTTRNSLTLLRSVVASIVGEAVSK